jgi:hypothetical protein
MSIHLVPLTSAAATAAAFAAARAVFAGTRRRPSVADLETMAGPDIHEVGR